MKRAKVTSWSKVAQHDRLPYIHQHGLTIALMDVLASDDKVAIRVKVPGGGASEYWFKVPANQTMLKTDARLEDMLFFIVPNAKLIVDGDGEPIRDEKSLRELGIEIKHLKIRW